MVCPPTVPWPLPISPCPAAVLPSTFEPFVNSPALHLLLLKSPLRLLKSPCFSRIGLFLCLKFRFDSGDGVHTNISDRSDDVLVIWLLSSNAIELGLVKISQF